MGPSPLDSSKKAIFFLLGAWVLLGLFGHAPWKPDEAYSFGLVYHILQSGDWVVPTLAGEPFMEKPPLFYVTAALFAKVFGGWLPLHDAARLASGFYALLTFYFLSKAAKNIQAALFLAACIGYVQHAHLLLTDNALMAGMALGFYGLSMTRTSSSKGGLLLGTGAGIAFMAKGLLGPGLLALTAIALLAFPAWRSRNYGQSWLWALLAVAPWLVVWPWLLHARSPALFDEWLWVQNFGRFTGANEIGGTPDHWHYVKALPWFALPAWPIAMWSVYSKRKTISSNTDLQLPVVAFLVMFAILSAGALARQLYALPMLLPLCLLAANGLETAPAWLRRPLDGAALWGAVLLGLSLWGLWLAWMLGWPPAVAARLTARFWGHVPSLHGVALGVAVAITLGCVLFIRNSDTAVRWAAASALLWGLAMTLWLAPLDYGKSYDGVIADMRKHVSAGACVATRDLTEPQRAAFHYYAGVVKTPGVEACPLVLVHTSSAKPPEAGAQWKLLWDGWRPGDENREHFWLYQASAR